MDRRLWIESPAEGAMNKVAGRQDVVDSLASSGMQASMASIAD